MGGGGWILRKKGGGGGDPNFISKSVNKRKSFSSLAICVEIKIPTLIYILLLYKAQNYMKIRLDKKKVYGSLFTFFWSNEWVFKKSKIPLKLQTATIFLDMLHVCPLFSLEFVIHFSHDMPQSCFPLKMQDTICLNWRTISPPPPPHTHTHYSHFPTQIYTDCINFISEREAKDKLIILWCTLASKINGTSERCFHVHFEAQFDFSRSEFTCTW